MASLILFTGKGGTGKSTISAATGIHYASKGYRTLVVSSDPAHSTDDTFGIPIGNSLVKITDNLWAKNLNAEERASEFFDTISGAMETMFSKSLPGFDTSLMTEWANFPGMDEVFALEEVHNLMLGVKYDIIVFDTAPTGHTLKALTAPDYLNTFLLKMLRMKAKLENLKGLFLRKSESSMLVSYLEALSERLLRIKVLLRNTEFSSINLVAIATEAGFQECYRTVRFLETLQIPVQNIIVNHVVPSFGSEVWADAKENPAVALLYNEWLIQQPYLGKYKQIASQHGINLVGMTKLPYEPRGQRLEDVSNILWGNKGLKFECPFSIKIDENDEKYYLRLKAPNIHEAVWHTNNLKYRFDDILDEWHKIPLPPELSDDIEERKVSRRKTDGGITLTVE